MVWMLLSANHWVYGLSVAKLLIVHAVKGNMLLQSWVWFSAWLRLKEIAMHGCIQTHVYKCAFMLKLGLSGERHTYSSLLSKT